LGAAAAMVAHHQAAEAIKLLVGAHDKLERRLIRFDLWENQRAALHVDADAIHPDCPCCGRRKFEYLTGAKGSSQATLCGRNSVQLLPAAQNGVRVDLQSIADRLARVADVNLTRFTLRAALPHGERTLDL